MRTSGQQKKEPRYETRTCLHSLESYKTLEWAKHSAECQASFFDATVEVFDRKKQEVVHTVHPKPEGGV